MDKFINSLIIVVVVCIVLLLITKLLVFFLPIILIAVSVLWIYKKFKNKFNNGNTKDVDDIEYMSSQQSGDVDNNSEVIDVDYKDVQ